MRDELAGHLADAVGADFNALEGFLNFVERVLLLREKAEREILFVGVAAGIGLVLADGGGFVVLGPGAEAVLRDALHLIQEMIAQIKQPFFLPLEEGGGLGVLRQAHGRALRLFLLDTIGDGLEFACFQRRGGRKLVIRLARFRSGGLGCGLAFVLAEAGLAAFVDLPLDLGF